MTHNEEVRERLLDVIHMMTDKSLRTLTKDQLFVDWDAVAAAMKPDSNLGTKGLLKPIPIPCDTTSVDDPCGMKDAPKTVTAIREDINKLMTNFEVELYRLMGIVEQVVMHLEQRERMEKPSTPCPNPCPKSWVPPFQPWVPPYQPPTTGDSFLIPFPGSTTCSTEALNKKVNEIERAILTAQAERGPQC